MDKKSKIFFLVFGLLIIGSIAVTYFKIMVNKDYVIENQIDCDPYSEQCFIWECDPASDVEGEACVDDPEEDIWYYKIVRRNASVIPLCNSTVDETCDPWTCDPILEKDCSEIFCDEETKVDQGVECNDPVKYTAENPEEEELDDEDAAEEDDAAADEDATGGADDEADSADDAAIMNGEDV